MNNCKKTKFKWNSKKVKRSPFVTLKAAKKAERSKTPIGFTARSSLKSMGRMPRSDGCYKLGQKYQSYY